MDKENVIRAISIPEMSQIVINTRRTFRDGRSACFLRNPNNRSHIFYLFCFADSPQGDDYWREYVNRVR